MRTGCCLSIDSNMTIITNSKSIVSVRLKSVQLPLPSQQRQALIHSNQFQLRLTLLSLNATNSYSPVSKTQKFQYSANPPTDTNSTAKEIAGTKGRVEYELSQTNNILSLRLLNSNTSATGQAGIEFAATLAGTVAVSRYSVLVEYCVPLASNETSNASGGDRWVSLGYSLLPLGTNSNQQQPSNSIDQQNNNLDWRTSPVRDGSPRLLLFRSTSDSNFMDVSHVGSGPGFDVTYAPDLMTLNDLTPSTARSIPAYFIQVDDSQGPDTIPQSPSGEKMKEMGTGVLTKITCSDIHLQTTSTTLMLSNFDAKLASLLNSTSITHKRLYLSPFKSHSTETVSGEASSDVVSVSLDQRTGRFDGSVGLASRHEKWLIWVEYQLLNAPSTDPAVGQNQSERRQSTRSLSLPPSPTGTTHPDDQSLASASELKATLDSTSTLDRSPRTRSRTKTWSTALSRNFKSSLNRVRQFSLGARMPISEMSAESNMGTGTSGGITNGSGAVDSGIGRWETTKYVVGFGTLDLSMKQRSAHISMDTDETDSAVERRVVRVTMDNPIRHLEELRKVDGDLRPIDTHVISGDGCSLEVCMTVDSTAFTDLYSQYRPTFDNDTVPKPRQKSFARTPSGKRCLVRAHEVRLASEAAMKHLSKQKRTFIQNLNADPLRIENGVEVIVPTVPVAAAWEMKESIREIGSKGGDGWYTIVMGVCIMALSSANETPVPTRDVDLIFESGDLAGLCASVHLSPFTVAHEDFFSIDSDEQKCAYFLLRYDVPASRLNAVITRSSNWDLAIIDRFSRRAVGRTSIQPRFMDYEQAIDCSLVSGDLEDRDRLVGRLHVSVVVRCVPNQERMENGRAYRAVMCGAWPNELSQHLTLPIPRKNRKEKPGSMVVDVAEVVPLEPANINSKRDVKVLEKLAKVRAFLQENSALGEHDEFGFSIPYYGAGEKGHTFHTQNEDVDEWLKFERVQRMRDRQKHAIIRKNLTEFSTETMEHIVQFGQLLYFEGVLSADSVADGEEVTIGFDREEFKVVNGETACRLRRELGLPSASPTEFCELITPLTLTKNHSQTRIGFTFKSFDTKLYRGVKVESRILLRSGSRVLMQVELKLHFDPLFVNRFVQTEALEESSLFFAVDTNSKFHFCSEKSLYLDNTNGLSITATANKYDLGVKNFYVIGSESEFGIEVNEVIQVSVIPFRKLDVFAKMGQRCTSQLILSRQSYDEGSLLVYDHNPNADLHVGFEKETRHARSGFAQIPFWVVTHQLGEHKPVSVTLVHASPNGQRSTVDRWMLVVHGQVGVITKQYAIRLKDRVVQKKVIYRNPENSRKSVKLLSSHPNIVQLIESRLDLDVGEHKYIHFKFQPRQQKLKQQIVYVTMTNVGTQEVEECLQITLK